MEESCIRKLGDIHQQVKSSDMSVENQLLELIPLNWLLLCLHHDIFLISEQPTASLALKNSIMERDMPARLWQYGIGQLLELLRDQLPSEYPAFLNRSIEIMTQLQKSIPVFNHAWRECLGDLARCCMAEAPDTEARKRWAQVARNYYLQLSGGLRIGRIQHHLAVLAWPDKLQQLFHYTKSLVNFRPFPAAGESISFLFDPVLKSEPDGHLVTAFVAAHGHLFHHSFRHFRGHMEQYLSKLREYIHQVGEEFEINGIYMALCNFAPIFEYGSENALLPPTFRLALLRQDEIEGYEVQEVSSSKMIHSGSSISFGTFSIILDQVGNEHVYPAVHVYLVFIWCMAHNDTTKWIDYLVPWKKVATFLNRMACDDIDFRVIERDEFPIMGGRCIPEDLLICGHVWGQSYFALNFFKYPTTEDNSLMKEPSKSAFRKYRCLWLDRQLSKVCYISSFLQDNC